jgi:hypothetical protein
VEEKGKKIFAEMHKSLFSHFLPINPETSSWDLIIFTDTLLSEYKKQKGE